MQRLTAQVFSPKEIALIHRVTLLLQTPEMKQQQLLHGHPIRRWQNARRNEQAAHELHMSTAAALERGG